MMAKLTEKKVNNMLKSVWTYSGGFKLPNKYIYQRNKIKEHLIKMDKYKYLKWKRKFQRNTFGVADGDVLSLKSIIELIDRVITIKKG